MYEAEFKLCETISNIKDSTLVKTSRKLNILRYRFFIAIYATMRFLDDYVDEQFLALSSEERKLSRPSAIEFIDRWLMQIKGDQDKGPMEQFVITALNETVSKSDITNQSVV